MAKVFFAGVKREVGKGFASVFRLLLERSDFADFVRSVRGPFIAVKIHFGELGNNAFVPPDVVRQLVEFLKDFGKKPFLTDSNTVYKGSRSDAVSHLITAYRHGFNLETVGAPVIIADGLRGLQFYEVPFNGKHFDKVKIAASIYEADGVVFLSHFKGHSAAGIGGAIKNIAMGAAPPAGKMEQHSVSKPYHKKERCVVCGRCMEVCPVEAISLNTCVQIDYKKCVGCGECVAVCPTGAITLKWDVSGKIFLERMAEYAAGVLKGIGPSYFLNVAITISADCDCWSYTPETISQDVGFFASEDPVAIDKATLDKIIEVNKGVDPFERLRPYIPHRYIFEYAASIGAGQLEYQLVSVEEN